MDLASIFAGVIIPDIGDESSCGCGGSSTPSSSTGSGGVASTAGVSATNHQLLWLIVVGIILYLVFKK